MPAVKGVVGNSDNEFQFPKNPVKPRQHVVKNGLGIADTARPGSIQDSLSKLTNKQRREFIEAKEKDTPSVKPQVKEAKRGADVREWLNGGKYIPRKLLSHEEDSKSSCSSVSDTTIDEGDCPFGFTPKCVDEEVLGIEFKEEDGHEDCQIGKKVISCEAESSEIAPDGLPFKGRFAVCTNATTGEPMVLLDGCGRILPLSACGGSNFFQMVNSSVFAELTHGNGSNVEVEHDTPYVGTTLDKVNTAILGTIAAGMVAKGAYNVGKSIVQGVREGIQAQRFRSDSAESLATLDGAPSIQASGYGTLLAPTSS